MKSPLLELFQVSKRFDAKAPLFSDINLKVYLGESYAIEGVSGRGKSTLLHCMAGLDLPTSGTIFFQGERLSPALRKSTFGFIFQAYNLLEDLTCEENIALAMQIGKKGVDLNRINYLLDALGMPSQKKKIVRYLSGGEKQRIAIGRALANQPKIIFAYEPSASLDAHTSSIVENLLFTLTKKEKISLVLATHDKELSAKCDNKFLLTPKGLEKF